MMREYTPIKMTADKDTGSFVKTLQGQTGVGFQDGFHVHKDWFAKTLTFDQVMETIDNEKGSREDIEGKIGEMAPHVDDDGRFCFRHADGRLFYPTDHALHQFAISVGLSTYFVKDMREDKYAPNGKLKFSRDSGDAETLKLVCDNALRRIDPKTDRKWRTYTDGTLRAWLSQDYTYVDNGWYLKFLNQIMPECRYSHWRGDADTLYGNILLPDSIIEYPEDDSDYGFMVSIGNSEIGTRKITQTPSAFRSICLNGLIHGKSKGKGIGKVHRGNIDLDDLSKDIYDNITKQIPLHQKALKSFLECRSFEFKDVKPTQVIAHAANELKLSVKEAKDVIENFVKFEGENRNLFGLINSITRASQQQSNQRWVDMDTSAGEFLSYGQNGWDRFVAGARLMTEKDVHKAFGISA